MQDETKRYKEPAAFTVTQTTYLFQQGSVGKASRGQLIRNNDHKMCCKSIGYEPRFFVANASPLNFFFFANIF